MTIIAVDGPAASGKGTLARRLATHYGLRHLDTGLVYRAVGLKVLRQKLDPVAAAAAVTLEDLENPELRAEAVGEAASKVAAIPAVRQALRALQRRFAERPPGAVLDGRDIGTVVFPEARAKLFVDASPEVRAERRTRELLERGELIERGAASIYSRVLQDMKARDQRDRTRDVAPLIPAQDAFVIDSSRLDADGVFRLAVEYVDRVLPGLAQG
jgi:cytidylate kinase